MGQEGSEGALQDTKKAQNSVSCFDYPTVPKWFLQGQKLVEHYRAFQKMITVRPGLVLSGYSNFFSCICGDKALNALFPQILRIFVHFSLQIAPWQLFTFHSKYPSILRRNPHRRVQLKVIYLTLTAKHEVSKSVSWVAGGTKMSNSPPILTLPTPTPSESSSLPKINHRLTTFAEFQNHTHSTRTLQKLLFRQVQRLLC